MLVSPLGSAQSPDRNLQLAASLQPTDEGGPSPQGPGRAGGSLRAVVSPAQGLSPWGGIRCRARRSCSGTAPGWALGQSYSARW